MHYIPLHIHTEYTFLSSCLKIDNLLSICDKYSFSSVGICDINNAYAFPSFSKECKKHNVKPVFGSSIDILINNKKFLISLFVRNEEGYRNLCYLISNHDSITMESLSEHKKGLILVIPCKTNNLVYNSFKGDYIDEIHRILYTLERGFDDSYLGIEIYQKEDKEVMKKVRDYANNYVNKAIAFPLHLYENKKDHIVYEMLNAIKNDTLINSNTPKEGPYYFLNDLALSTLYTKEELNETNHLVEMIEFDFNIKRGKLLCFNPDSLLNKRKAILFKCKENMLKNNIPTTKEYMDRLEYELNIIEQMGFLDYFLIVADYVSEAKKRKIPVGPGRGSVVGSLISYCLGITEIDSLKYNLLFERFLNPGRVTMPDIDIDISDIYRDDIIEYIRQKYGIDKTANIITYQTIGAKQAIRDIGKIFSFNPIDINTLAMSFKGNSLSLDEIRNKNDEFNKLCLDPYFHKIYALSKKIEGYIRQSSLHPAGIILNNDSLENIVPTTKDEKGIMTCQYEYSPLEEQGFLKMDILSLRTLTTISNIVDKINAQTIKIDLKNIPLDDSKTYLTLNAGLTLGIFQIEKSDEFKRAIKEIKMETFDDIVALLALCRPGPISYIKTYADNKNKVSKIEYIDPSLEDILSPTYGIIIYQEQIMQIVQKVASFTMSEADIFRRAISKKDESQMVQLKDKFYENALKNGYSKETSEKIFENINRFASYGFNKSHSVAYSLISYKMAYLKAHYPCEFYSALLDTQSLADNKYIKYMDELSLLDIRIALPDINYSSLEYRPRFKELVIPFTAIKGLSYDLSKSIVYERNQNGPYKDLISFITRMKEYNISEKDICTLIDSGAFDSFEYNRATKKANVKRIMQFVENTYNSFSIFSEKQLERISPNILVVDENEEEKNRNEYEVLGILISSSLFANYSNAIKKYDLKPIQEAKNFTSNTSIAVIISDIHIFTTKNHKTMATIKCYDNTSLLSATLFSDVYEKEKIKLMKNTPLILNGSFRKDDLYGLTFYVDSIRKLEENK